MHLIAIDKSEVATLVACCDIELSRAESACEKYGGKAYSNWKEMLDKEKIDVVHICLPHHLHIPVSEYAIKKGINVLCEKPMAIDYKSAEDTVALAEEKGVSYGIIFQCRYNESIKFVKRALDEGKLGKVISARSILTWDRRDSYYMDDDWHGTWDKEGGGVIINQTIHSIDMINYLIADEFEKVECTMSNRTHKLVDVEDTAEGIVTYSNGAKYIFYATNNYGCDEPVEIRLCCEKGKVVLGYEDAVITYNNGEIEEIHKPKKGENFEGYKAYWGNEHSIQIEDYYDGIINKREPYISGKVALNSHRLICEIYRVGKESMGMK